MKVTRILENLDDGDRYHSIGQERFVELLAKHKALLLQCDDGAAPLSTDEFAQFTESLKLQKYEYVGGAGESELGLVTPCGITSRCRSMRLTRNASILFV